MAPPSIVLLLPERAEKFDWLMQGRQRRRVERPEAFQKLTRCPRAVTLRPASAHDDQGSNSSPRSYEAGNTPLLVSTQAACAAIDGMDNVLLNLLRRTNRQGIGMGLKSA